MNPRYVSWRPPGRLGLPVPRLLAERGPLIRRSAWIGLVGLLLILFAAGAPVIFTQMGTTCSGTCQQWQPGPGDLTSLHRLGLSTPAWAISFIALDALIFLSFSSVATVLFWRHQTVDRMAVFCAFMLLGLGASFTQTIRASGSRSSLWLPVHLIQFLGLALLLIFFYLFPDGRFVPRWTRWAAMCALPASAIIAFAPWEQVIPAGVAIPVLCIGIAGLLGTAVVAQVYRYRRVSDVTQRFQIKWPVSGFAAAILLFMGLAVLFSVYLGQPTALPPTLRDAAFLLLAYNSWRLPFVILPFCIGVAVLRNRLFDIDIIINRTLVYGGLTTAVIAFYIAIVGYLGALFRSSNSLIVSLLATGLVAVLFHPLHERLQRAVNRLTYGDRDEPYSVLSRLGRRLEGTLVPETVLPTIVDTTAQALRLPYAAITLKQGADFSIAAATGTAVQDPLILPLIYQGETLGQLLLAPRAPGEAFSPADRRLLDDLARHTGIAAYAVRLTTDLQRSRERLVNAREEERRRLRRDLHDGLGPTLASLFQRLDLAGGLAPRNPEAAVQMLDSLKVQVKEMIGDIRRLVYALRPPTLDELGLVAAIRQHIAQCEGHGLSMVLLAPEQLPPVSAAVEVAAYRIALEAVTNVTRHSHARTCHIVLQADEALSVEITDDGVGLPTPYHAGVGVSSMRERAAELGGECRIEAGSNGGTRVVARLPMTAG